MAITRFDIENGLEKALFGKNNILDSMSEDKKEELISKALSTIQLCLSNKVLQEIIKEDIANGL